MILEQLVAVSAVPEFQLTSEELAYGSPFDWIIFILLVFLFLSMIVVFVKNMLTKAEKILADPKRYDFWISYFKTTSSASIFAALLTASLGLYEALFHLAVYPKLDFNGVAGPLGESLLFLVMGFGIALMGTTFDFLSRWKRTSALTMSPSTKTVSTPPK